MDPSLSPLALCSVPTCSRVLRRPHLTSCCGKNVCILCRKSGRRCPIPDCGSEQFETLPNRAHMKEVLGYRVFCGNKERGCEWQGELSGYEPHLNQCSYMEVQCEFCKEFVENHQLKGHLEVCKKRPIDCPNGCQMKVMWEELAEHKVICRLEKVPCPFASYKCCTATEMRRMDVEKHLDAALSTHWKAVTGEEAALQAKWKDKVETLMAEQEVILAEKEKKKESLKEELQKATHTMTTLENQLLVMEESLKEFREESRRAKEDLEAEIHVTKGRELDHLNLTANELRHLSITKCHGSPLPRPARVVSRPTPPTGQVYTLPAFDLSIDRFSQRRQDNESWWSPPLYSHDGGYKLSIQVYPAGNLDGYLTFVSVYAVMMKGENDDYLRWPFSGRIQLTMLNRWKNPTGIKSTINMGRSCGIECRQRVKNGMFNEGYGIHKFVNQPTVNKFLWNDTMILRVNIQVD